LRCLARAILKVKLFNIKGAAVTDSLDRVLEQWHATRPDIDPAPMGVVGRIQRACRRLEHGLRVHFAEHGLQLWEFDVLATLRRAGQLTAGELVRASMVTSGAMTNRIDRLVARNLVTRQTDPDNRRSVLIDLTDRGRTLIDELLADHVDNETRLLASLTPREQQQLAGLLRKLLTGLGDVPAQHREAQFSHSG
jgi:DNA-binding MarR family transcriptional regulator